LLIIGDRAIIEVIELGVNIVIIDLKYGVIALKVDVDNRRYSLRVNTLNLD
jgi:hypothetical protein